MIAYFIPTVNTIFSQVPLPVFQANEYYKSYNCRTAFILKSRILSSLSCFCQSQEEKGKIPFSHLYGNFFNFREEFLKFPDFYEIPFSFSIDIRISITFFYKELSTFSTDFSTLDFSLFSSAFADNYHNFTISVSAFSAK